MYENVPADLNSDCMCFLAEAAVAAGLLKSPFGAVARTSWSANEEVVLPTDGVAAPDVAYDGWKS